MGVVTSKHAWDEASTPAAHSRTRTYESDWNHSVPGNRPNPLSYLEGASPGEKLALLRSDLGLRWESGERIAVEWYRRVVPDLADEAYVALIYEEFCLREDHGESPEPAAFFARFPEVAPALKRVLDIHDLVGSGHGTTGSFNLGNSSSHRVPFPEVGQTIAGFDLVEELGRGGFARVFRAKERDLADRLVALKVARSGSREPQTLARLQHTHIVPVHSYRIDPNTGLHLLCMPYFGRITLAHVLADKSISQARSGADIVAALDRLDHDESIVSSRPAGRRALASRPFARAIAWWGARLAEALQHAHERGVLHRDIKPSNVLVTGDGMPMLLDFNLAHEALVEGMEDSPALGGTVGYMSPEHLEALAEGRREGVDGRSDIYGLGVVLYEAMGERPFGPPAASRSVREVLLKAAEERRFRPPDLRKAFPETPPALAAVVAKCLAPNPDDRYATAADLAIDLQAVADDKALVFAREPMDDRVVGWMRRNRQILAVAASVFIAVAVSGFLYVKGRSDRGEKRVAIAELKLKANQSLDRNDYDLCIEQCTEIEHIAGTISEFAAAKNTAHFKKKVVEECRREREKADAFFPKVEDLRFRLLGFDGNRKPLPINETDVALEPFYVQSRLNWKERSELNQLDGKRREKLVNDITQLLFLQAWACANTNNRELLQLAVSRCEKAMGFVDGESRGPWKALRVVAAAKLMKDPPPRIRYPALKSVQDAWECYQWGRVSLLADKADPVVTVQWLERATQFPKGQFWLEFDTAYQEDRANFMDQALAHYSAALKIEPNYSRALFNRGRVYARRGRWDQAMEDLDRALAIVKSDAEEEGPSVDSEIDEIQVERGHVFQSTGKMDEASAAYQTVIDSPQAGALRQVALFNHAKLDFDRGRIDQAHAGLDLLISQNPTDMTARLGRAILLLRLSRPADAEQDLDRILEANPTDADALAYRARARLARNQPAAADKDAALALKLSPTPRHDRLRTRTLLAMGKFDGARLDDPDEIRLFPGGFATLVTDLRAAASARDSKLLTPSQRSTRAAILSALGDPAAVSEATKAIADDPRSIRARLILARVLLARGDRDSALKQVDQAMKSEPDDPRLRVLRSRILLELNRPGEAVAELDLLERLGGSAILFAPRAEANMRLGRAEAAQRDWNHAIAYDPDDPISYLGRARAFVRLGKVDLALADLQRSADLASDRPEILAQVTLAYALLLPKRPNQAERVKTLAHQAWSAVKLKPL